MIIKSRTSIFIGLIIVIISLVAYRTLGFKGNNSVQKEVISPGVRLVNPTEFSGLIRKGDGFLVDVHIPEQIHIPGTDAFIPYNEISTYIGELPEDKSTPILVYCRSGSMSKSASKEISGLGYTNVYDLDGGINAYKHQINEVIITPDNQDFGTVVYGDVPTTTFTLTNFTSDPLKITRVSTSCGCTSAEVEEKELGAFESTVINVSFNPALHESDEDLGDIVRTIFVQTDNSNYERVTAEITAHVVKR